MRYLTSFGAVLVSSFAVGTASPASFHQLRAVNDTAPYQLVNSSSAQIAATRAGQGAASLTHVTGLADGPAASQMAVPVVVHVVEASPTSTVDPSLTVAASDICPAVTFTYGQLVTDPAQTITSATTTYLLASSTCPAGTLSYYIQTSTAVAALPYSELTAATRTLTVTEFVDEEAVGTGVWEVSPSTVTVVKTIEGTGVVDCGGERTYMKTESGVVAYCSEKTVEVTETVTVGVGMKSTTTVTSVVTVSSLPTTSLSTGEWTWFQGAEVEALCASLVGTATKDVTTTATSTTFVRNFVTSTSDFFNTTTYLVALNRTATAHATSTNIVPAYSNVNSSSVYNVSVPSTVQTSTTSTFVDVSEVTETPTTTTTEEVPSTSTTVTSATVTTTSQGVAPVKRNNDVAGLFDAALAENKRVVVGKCLAKFGQPAIALTHTASEVQSVLEKNGTVISTRTSLISAPTLVPTVVATTTATAVEQVTSTSLITEVIPVPTTITYTDGTFTVLSVTTTLSTTTLTAPAVVITESTPTVVATSTQTLLFTTVVYSTCIADGQPCADPFRPDLCCGQACTIGGLPTPLCFSF
ncbi:hypothetical protein YB2330_003012 [Saitoella coloradoensis]